MTGIQVFDGRGVWCPREDVDRKLDVYVTELSERHVVWVHSERWNLLICQIRLPCDVPVYLEDDGRMWRAVNLSFAIEGGDIDGAQFFCKHLAGPAEDEVIEP